MAKAPRLHAKLGSISNNIGGFAAVFTARRSETAEQFPSIQKNAHRGECALLEPDLSVIFAVVTWIKHYA